MKNDKEYDLKTHWEFLEALLKEYDEENKSSQFNDPEDNAAYQIIRNMIDDMLQMGKKMVDDKTDQFTKLQLGLEIKGLAKNRFKDGIPFINGPRSLAFTEKVFLKNVQNSLNIVYDKKIQFLSNVTKFFGVGKLIGVDVEAEKKRAMQYEEKIKNRVNEYKKKQSLLLPQSVFATNIRVEISQTITITETHAPPIQKR